MELLLFSDDIAIESSNVYIKKKIFIKHLENILPYQRRNWGILIIKDDLDKNTLKLAFDADFKIWMTSSDVKVFMMYNIYVVYFIIIITTDEVHT